jgi:hypothetical protein
MKKYIHFLIIGFTLLTACDSTEDLYKELDKLDTGLVYDLEYTLTSDDYDLAGEAFGNFSAEEDAVAAIPDILKENFPQFGAGSSAKVTYDLYNPIRINNEDAYTMVPADYDAIGEASPRLNSQNDITKAAAYLYPDAEPYDVVTLTYDYYAAGETTTKTSKVTYYDAAWRISYVPTTEDYTFMGQNFPNFDSRSTARARIGVLFDRLFPFGQEGEIRTAVFNYYTGTVSDFLVVYQFDGTNWKGFEDVVQRTLQLGNDGAVWVPDNTIKYTLASGDYTAIGNATAGSNPSGSASALQYGNFDTSLWTEAQIIAAFSDFLLETYPGAAEGQKYLISYKTYSGAAGTAELLLILDGGTYKKVQ